MITFPKSPSQFKRQAEAGFRRANPDAVEGGLTIEWVYGPKRVTFPTGITGFVGQFTARAIGHRTRNVHADATRETGLSVR